MSSIDHRDRTVPMGPRPLITREQAPQADVGSAFADIVLPPGPGPAERRRRKRAGLDGAAPRALPPTPVSRPLPPISPRVRSLLKHPLPPLPVVLGNRNFTHPPAFRAEPKALVLNEPYDLRGANNRPTPRLMAHVFSLNERELGGTFLTQAHEEMTDSLARFCCVERPGEASARMQMGQCLKALQFSTRMASELEAYHEDPVGTGLASIAEAVMQRVKSPLGRAVFPGGIVGNDDKHAILFEMTQDGHNVRLRIYNTGVGIENHHAHPQDPTRLQSYLEIENLAPGLLDEPQFIETLLHFSMPTATQTIQERISALYGLLRAMGDVVSPIGQWSKPQDAPNCAWKVLRAFLKAHTDALSLCTFKAYSQSRLLEHYMNDNGIESPDDLIFWDAGKHSDGALVERIVQDAHSQFAKTEEKLRKLTHREHEAPRDVRAFIKAQRDAMTFGED